MQRLKNSPIDPQKYLELALENFCLMLKDLIIGKSYWIYQAGGEND